MRTRGGPSGAATCRARTSYRRKNIQKKLGCQRWTPGSDSDFVIVARTDARATRGLDEAIERSRQNKKTGADAVFIEAPRDIDEMKRIGREI